MVLAGLRRTHPACERGCANRVRAAQPFGAPQRQTAKGTLSREAMAEQGCRQSESYAARNKQQRAGCEAEC